MKKVFSWIKQNPHRAMFLVPIVLVAIISISHVVTWYDMANPMMWAMYLSIAIEIAAMTALVAVNNQSKAGVWFMFGIVTFIQVIGNVFFCFKEIDADGDLFKSWVELTLPVWELMGTDVSDVVGLKRWLAILEGGLLPIISLTSLHFFVNYKLKPEGEEYFEKRNKLIVEKVEEKEKNVTPLSSDSPIIKEDNEFEGPGIEVKEKDEEDVQPVEEPVTPSPVKESISPDKKEELRDTLIKKMNESGNPEAFLGYIGDKIKEINKTKESPIISPKSSGKTNIERID